MQSFIEAWSNQYDEEKYSTDFFLGLLKKVKESDNPEDLGHRIIKLIHWKDGKVFKSDNKDLVVNGIGYSLSPAKPNTYNPAKHKEILLSDAFYKWASEVRNENRFSPNFIEALRGSPFYLWGRSSIVIPTFVMHVLSPKVYPLFDQHVERAKRALLAQKLNRDSTQLDLEAYISYKSFFSDLVLSYAQNGSLEHYREVDKALWSFGKWLKMYNHSSNNSGKKSLITTAGTYKPDLTFKKRVLELIEDGVTQKEAIEKAASALGVVLPDSYYLYPGSHIHRWRKQL